MRNNINKYLITIEICNIVETTGGYYGRKSKTAKNVFSS